MSERPGIKVETEVFTPVDIRKNIIADWIRINLNAELCNPIYTPFDKSDLYEAESKIAPHEYINRSAVETAKILGLKLDGSLRGKTILSVGSGQSKLGARARESGVLFVDTDPFFRPVGQIELPKGALGAATIGEQLPFGDDTFDEVLLSFVLCVVKDPEIVLREAFRVVKPGGKIRVFPVVVFEDPRKISQGGIRYLRRGMDSFTLVIENNQDRNFGELLTLLLEPEKLCVKPDKGFIKRRLKGYFYDQEYDKPQEKWWLGDFED